MPSVHHHFEDAATLRRVEATLVGAFASAGYDEIIVPLVEDDEVYVRGAELKLIQGDRVLGLRADFTGPVARIVGTRLGDVHGPIRLCYRGALFRGGRQGWQAGCELFGVRGAEGDAESIRVALAALDALGVEGARVVLGSVGTLRETVPEALDDPTLRRALDRRDAAALTAHPRLLALLHDRRPDLPLAAVLDALGALDPQSAARVSIDPAHIREFPYYTGVVFDLYAPGYPRPLGGGGRYDGLCARWGRARPAVGFSFDVDVLVRGPTLPDGAA